MQYFHEFLTCWRIYGKYLSININIKISLFIGNRICRLSSTLRFEKKRLGLGMGSPIVSRTKKKSKDPMTLLNVLYQIVKPRISNSTSLEMVSYSPLHLEFFTKNLVKYCFTKLDSGDVVNHQSIAIWHEYILRLKATFRKGKCYLISYYIFIWTYPNLSEECGKVLWCSSISKC